MPCREISIEPFWEKLKKADPAKPVVPGKTGEQPYVPSPAWLLACFLLGWSAMVMIAILIGFFF
ncbi:MAG: hypothetical protein ACXVKI_01140 [Flavisolibacter sp.]